MIFGGQPAANCRGSKQSAWNTFVYVTRCRDGKVLTLFPQVEDCPLDYNPALVRIWPIAWFCPYKMEVISIPIGPIVTN